MVCLVCLNLHFAEKLHVPPSDHDTFEVASWYWSTASFMFSLSFTGSFLAVASLPQRDVAIICTLGSYVGHRQKEAFWTSFLVGSVVCALKVIREVWMRGAAPSTGVYLAMGLPYTL